MENFDWNGAFAAFMEDEQFEDQSSLAPGNPPQTNSTSVLSPQQGLDDDGQQGVDDDGQQGGSAVVKDDGDDIKG
jgi:hypothetical protein